MSARNLTVSLAPERVAVVGASSRPGSVGKVVLDNLIAGGFSGAIHPVNPKYQRIGTLTCYRRLPDLPAAPDLCIVATPPPTLPQVIRDVGECGCGVAVIITAGVSLRQCQELLAIAGRAKVRLIGPNTIGLQAPRVKLNASFCADAALPGRLGLISQSGAIVSSIVDWAIDEGIGFSQAFSLGDMADVDIADCLDLLAQDHQTGAILLYMEAIRAPRKFMSAARAAARVKPVIAVKPGRHEAAAQAALTHTGALSGADDAVEAALRRAGVIRVAGLHELLSAAEITARFKPLSRGRVAIITNGGGAGVLAVDHLEDRGCELATLSPATIAALETVLPPTWSRGNPVDIIGDAPPERYTTAITAVAADAGVDALVIMNCPTGLASPTAAADAVGAMAKSGRINGRPVLASWLGGHRAHDARRVLNAAGIASLDTPLEAAEAVRLLTEWSDLHTQLERVPERYGTLKVDPDSVKAIIEQVARDGREMLSEVEAKAVLAAYGVPVSETRFVRTPDEARAAASRLLPQHGSLVLKLVSRVLTHKSDVGGVVLDLTSADAVAGAAEAMRERLGRLPEPVVPDGFTVQPMVSRPQAHELFVGVKSDAAFGPVIVFGAGGTGVEAIGDTATALLPIDDVLAEDLITRTRISRLLAGYRNRPATDRRAVVMVLKAVSQLLIDVPAIRALDVNPLLADEQGVVALDARIEIDPERTAMPGPNPFMAVRPYPSAWVSRRTIGGVPYLVRPIRPVDAKLYPAFLARVNAEDLRQRFHMSVRELSHETLVRLTQLDYDRDIAFAAIREDDEALAGIVRYASDADRSRAEFGILVRSDLQGRGLGTALMKELIAYAKSEGIGVLEGVVEHGNHAVQALCRSVGFTLEPDPDARLLTARLPFRSNEKP